MCSSPRQNHASQLLLQLPYVSAVALLPRMTANRLLLCCCARFTGSNALCFVEMFGKHSLLRKAQHDVTSTLRETGIYRAKEEDIREQKSTLLCALLRLAP